MQLIRVDNEPFVTVEHRNQAITWNVSVYDKTKYKDNPTVFAEINRYLAVMPIARQDAIFQAYLDIKAVLDSSIRSEQMAPKLNALVKTLYDNMPLTELEHWVMYHAGVRLPDNLEVNVGEDLNRERTYVKQDYEKLVVLTIGLRMMIPIWGEYQRILVGQNNGAAYKEKIAVMILSLSNVMQYDATGRLLVFINSTVQAANTNTSAIMSGLGSSELPEIIWAGAIVRRLAVAIINQDNERGGLVKNVYGFTTSSLKDIDVYFGGLRQKNAEGAEDDNEFSKLERQRGKQLMSIGEVETYPAYATLNSTFSTDYTDESLNVIRIAKSIEPTVTDDIIFSCIAANPNIAHLELTRFQRAIIQWVSSTIQSVRAIDNLKRIELNRIFLVAIQAVLIKWEFYQLALLIGATMVPPNEDMITLHGITHRVTQKTMEDLLKIYRSKVVSNKSSNERQGNLGYVAIGILSAEVAKTYWKISVPECIKHIVPENDVRRGYMMAPPDISELMARLVIKIDNVSKVGRYTCISPPTV